MKTYDVEIKGTTPLIFNVRNRELDDEIKRLKKDEYQEWEEKNWQKKAPINRKGNIIIPVNWIKAAFVNACKHSMKVPHFAMSKKQTYTRYAESMYFQDTDFECKITALKSRGSYMGAQGANSKTKVWKVYPEVDEWETSFKISDPAGRMTEKELNELITWAGMFEGIGDFRKINCGRFEVISIKEK